MADVTLTMILRNHKAGKGRRADLDLTEQEAALPPEHFWRRILAPMLAGLREQVGGGIRDGKTDGGEAAGAPGA